MSLKEKILSVGINFSLANCELNYTPFDVFGAFAQFKEIVELSTLTHWFDWSAKAKVLNTKTLNFASNEVLCKPTGHSSVKL